MKSFDGHIKKYLSKQFNLQEEQVEMMLPDFKKTLSRHMENLEEVYGQNELEALATAAHTIKGAFLNLGLTDCADLALKIEGGAARKDTSIDYGTLIDDMGKMVDEIVNE